VELNLQRWPHFESHLIYSMEAAWIVDVTPSNRAFAATSGPPRPQKPIGYARPESNSSQGELRSIAVCNEAWCALFLRERGPRTRSNEPHALLA
jgi:hypothetical protein